MNERITCPPSHKHGETLNCYKRHLCGCDDCRANARQYADRVRRMKAYGRWVDPFTDAAPVREHIIYLRSCGMGWKRIADTAGVAPAVVSRLLYGESNEGRRGQAVKRIRVETAEAIMALEATIAVTPDTCLVDARSTRRRLQALGCNGWSQSRIGTMLGRTPSRFNAVVHSHLVTAKTHREVAALFEQLWNVQAPNVTWREQNSYARTTRYAREHGWLPALAWDDIDTDPTPPAADELTDAQADVDEVRVEQAVAGIPSTLTQAERRLVIERLHGLGYSDRNIAPLADCTDRTVLRIREELGLESTYDGYTEAAA